MLTGNPIDRLISIQQSKISNFRTTATILSQCDDAGELASAEEFERGAAAGRDVRDAGGDARLRDARERIAAADYRRPVHLRDRPGDRHRAVRERVDFEDAHRTVPRDGLRS